MKKAIIVVIALAFAGYVGWKVYVKVGEQSEATGGRGSGGPRGEATVAVEVQPVRTETIRDISQFTGTLQPKSYFVVAPKVAGLLQRLMVNIGDTVHNGDLIAVIDDAEYAQQVEQAKAELQVAQANLDEARSALAVQQRELERVQALRDKKIASESELDSARAATDAQEARYKVAQAQVEQQKAALAAAEVRLSYTRIAAVWEGGGTRLVGERFVDEGSMLRSNEAIVSIIDISSLTAVVNVIERDYSKIDVGQEVFIRADAYPGKSFTGRVARVAPLLRETSRQARVEITVVNTDRMLKPGMFVVAEIEFGSHDNATVVPVSALVRRDGDSGIFLVSDDEKTVRFVPVTTGFRTETMVEVLEPSISGRVVTLGQHLLSEGSAITLGDSSAGGDDGGAQ